MTTQMMPQDLTRMVDAKTATVDRRIFADQEIYDLEMERIFARAWNFMCHESQIPNPGDFFMTFIGEDRVICVRDNEGVPQVLVNSCRHRGNAVCRAEEGHATSFMCTYHGWTYDLKGALVGVPGFKEVYHEELDRENWGLIKAGQVESYKGFVFANMDPEAPNLHDFLGDVGRIGIDLIAEQGDIYVLPGVQKYIIPCNWKLAVDNLFDWYHVGISHRSALLTGAFRRPEGRTPSPSESLTVPQMVMLGEFGHAISGPRIVPGVPANQTGNPAFSDEWRETEKAKEALGPVGIRSRGHPNIFPNLWVASNVNQLSLRLPRGPHKTEIWWFSLIYRNGPPELIKAQINRANHVFGPSGNLEQDDGENWAESTKAMSGVVSRRYPVNFSMNLRAGEILGDENSPAHIECNVNEHGQLWTYRAWADWMAAESWDDLRANHTQIPRDFA